MAGSVQLATPGKPTAAPPSVASNNPLSFQNPRSGEPDPMGLADIKVDHTKVPVRLDYYGGGPVCGVARFLIHNPLKITNPYPNDIAPYCGGDLVLGIRQKRPSRTSIFEQPLDVAGELHFSFFHGRWSSDRMTPDQVGADEILREFTDQVEDELNRELHEVEGQVEQEIDREVKEATGVNPDVDLDIDDIDINPNNIDIDDLGVSRDSSFYAGFLQWRRLAWSGISVLDGRLSLFDLYLNLGVGMTYTKTKVTVVDETITKSARDWMARLTVETDVARYEGDKWMMALRGGGGFMLGQQGGPEAFVGLALFRKTGKRGP